MFMVLLILVFVYFVVGVAVGAIWQWRIGYLIGILTIASFFGCLFVGGVPSQTAIFSDSSSFLWLVLTYGPFVGIVAGAAAIGAILGAHMRRKFLQIKNREKLAETPSKE